MKGMKRKMRIRYTFHTVEGELIGWGDCPEWAAKVREAWARPGFTEEREHVMFLTDRPIGAIGPVPR